MRRIRLDLSSHCIETEVERRYNRAISTYFSAEPYERHVLEASIDMMRSALKSLNFPKLRTDYPALAGGTEGDYALSEKNGHWLIFMGDEVVEVTPTKA